MALGNWFTPFLKAPILIKFLQRDGITTGHQGFTQNRLGLHLQTLP